MILFDIPQSRQTARCQLLRWLRANDFGYLQHSVWVRPDPVEKISAALKDFRDDVESLTLMDAYCCRGYSDNAIVKGAWDFDKINARYRAHLSLLAAQRRKLRPMEGATREQIQALRQERNLWMEAITHDPLLPRALWPKGYLGEESWKRRCEALRL